MSLLKPNSGRRRVIRWPTWMDASDMAVDVIESIVWFLTFALVLANFMCLAIVLWVLLGLLGVLL